MDEKDLPENVRAELHNVKSLVGPEVTGVIASSIHCCPDWESAKDSIHHCLQFLIDEATLVQNIINKE